MSRQGSLAPASRAVCLACWSCSVITVITVFVAAAASAVSASITAAAVIAAVTTAALTIILCIIHLLRPEGRQHGGERHRVGRDEEVLLWVGLLQALQEHAESRSIGDLGHLRLEFLALGQLEPRCRLGSVRATATSTSWLRPLPLRSCGG